MSDEIPPPPLPARLNIDPWRTVVDLKLDEHDRRIRIVEVAVGSLPRIEKKVDEMYSMLLQTINREAAREPSQERDLGNVKLELAKQSAIVGGKWGAVAGVGAAVVAALAKYLLGKVGIHLE